jgi:hypothetical protein
VREERAGSIALWRGASWRNYGWPIQGRPRIGVAANWDGNYRSYLRWFVPVRSCIVRRSVDFKQLGEVNVCPEILFNGGNVGAESVSRNLESSSHALAEVADKVVGASRVALSGQVRQNEFRFAINRHPDIGVSPFLWVIGRKMFFFRVNKTPEFISLNKARTNISHAFVEQFAGVFADSEKNGKNRTLVDASDTGDGADAHALHQQGDDLRRLGCVGVVPSQRLSTRSGKCGATTGAAKPLNAQFSVGSESISSSVLTFQAGHGLSPLVFLRWKPDNRPVTEVLAAEERQLLE